MAESRLIEAYLTELRYSVAKLDDAAEIVEEVGDHLYTALEALTKEGVDVANAESQALGQFGSAALVSRVFNEEAKRGGAVSTTLTRRAGLAAIASVPLITLGQFGNEVTRQGFMDNNPVVHGASLVVLSAGLAAFVAGLWGIRRRHGGMGGTGRFLFWWFVASPFIAAPFLWGAPFVLAVEWLFIITLLGAAMTRARILPLPAVALFTFWPLTALLVISGMTALDRDAGPWFLTLLVPIAVGLMWLGWAMWREPALDVRSGNSGAPFAAA